MVVKKIKNTRAPIANSLSRHDIVTAGRSKVLDNDGALWVQEVVRRGSLQKRPVGWCQHQMKRISNLFSFSKESKPASTEDQSPLDYNRDQFTIITSMKSKTWRQKLLGELDSSRLEYNPRLIFIEYVNWTFTVASSLVVVHFLLIYFILTFIFALLLLWAGNAYPDCIITSADSMPLNQSPNPLADAFELSWTTFTTVGYGHIHSGTASLNRDEESCTFVISILNTEALTGLLYAGMSAAILYGKVNRILSHAPVVFSHAICITYGDNPIYDDLEDFGKMTMKESSKKIDVIDEEGKNYDKKMKLLRSYPPTLSQIECKEYPKDYPPTIVIKSQPNFGHDNMSSLKNSGRDDRKQCPCLTIQMVNELANKPCSEILDAHLKVIAVKSGKENTKIYANVIMNEIDHPFFHSVWHVRHKLDENSTLLTSETRRRISQNNGWPSHWNSPEIVRDKLNFTELIVTITGVSNISATQVVKHKAYSISDLLVGYEFAPILYQEHNRHVTKVDMSLIHDIIVQRGKKIEHPCSLDCINSETIRVNFSSRTNIQNCNRKSEKDVEECVHGGTKS